MEKAREKTNESVREAVKVVLFVVTNVDIGQNSDFAPHCLGIFPTYEAAKTFVKEDIFDFKDDLYNNFGEEPDTDYEKFVCQTVDGMYGSQWSIDEVEMDPIIPGRGYPKEF